MLSIANDDADENPYNFAIQGTGANSPATVTLGNLSQTYDGTAKAVSVTTAPPSLLVHVTYDGLANAPTNVGTYTVIGTINDAIYAGAATNTLSIVVPYDPTGVTAAQSATLGAGQSATASTAPTLPGQAGLAVTATNGGGSDAPRGSGQLRGSTRRASPSSTPAPATRTFASGARMPTIPSPPTFTTPRPSPASRKMVWSSTIGMERTGSASAAPAAPCRPKTRPTTWTAQCRAGVLRSCLARTARPR